MGILSNLVSDTFGDTSDVDSFDNGLSDVLKSNQSLIQSQQATQPQQATQSQSSPNALNSFIGGSPDAVTSAPASGGMMASMSDINSKQEISYAKKELDKILSNVYLRLKGKHV